ncbi:MAG: LysM peptidoglycan-binding domain-containing protein [Candidatus Dormibacteria bacterium]
MVPATSAGLLGSGSPRQGDGLVALSASAKGRPVDGPQRGFIVKPMGSILAGSLEPPKASRYIVQSGDVLGAIAAKFSLRLDSVRQSNDLGNPDALQIGQELLIPPTNGVLVRVAAGDTVQSLADRYHVEAGAVIEYNMLRNPQNLDAGSLIMLPDGTGLLAAEQTQVTSPSPPPASRGATRGSTSASGSSYNHFPFGQCTFWVASRRNIPWNGNAWEWFGQAQRAGYSTGTSPRVGAIMVTWENRVYGHVAVVEAVRPDGSWVVSEMNYQGFGIVDRRAIRPGQVPLIGFIY